MDGFLRVAYRFLCRAIPLVARRSVLIFVVNKILITVAQVEDLNKVYPSCIVRKLNGKFNSLIGLCDKFYSLFISGILMLFEYI